MGKERQPYRFDFENKKIILSRKFEKKLSDVSGQEFKKFCELHDAFPDFDIIRKEVHITKKKEAYKGLTYGYMERYIAVKGTRADRQEYDDKRLLAECHSKRFPVIKQWFLHQYPEVEQYGAREEFINRPNVA